MGWIMKKVLFMISSMNIGGVEKSLLSLLSIIPREEYDITIYMLEKKGGFLEYVPEWVKVEEATWFQKIKPIIMQPPLKTIRNYIKSKQYFKAISFIGVYLLSKKLDDRYLYYCHVFRDVPKDQNTYDVAISYQGPTDIIDYYISHKIKAKKTMTWVHFDVSMHQINIKLYTKLYSMFNQIIIVSQEAKKRLIEKIPSAKEKTKVFLNIVPHHLINEMAKEITFDDSFNGIRLVTVGRLSKEKGQDLAVEALSMLRRDGYNVRWYCIGDGNYRSECEVLIEQYNLKEDFILLGATTNPYPFIKQADIYVQTSRHEGYCLTLAEAKCLKKPIISTDFTGAVEQIENYQTGFIVGCSAEELYREIKFLIDYPEERERVINNLSNSTIEINRSNKAQKLQLERM